MVVPLGGKTLRRDAADKIDLFVPRDLGRKYGQLTVKDGRLHFYAENQGVYQWSTLPHGEDPPVFGRYGGRGRWGQEDITLTEHLILMCLIRGRHVPRQLWSIGRLVGRGQVRCDRQQTFRRWPSGPGAGCIPSSSPVATHSCSQLRTAPRMVRVSVRVGAKTEQPLQFLRLDCDNARHVRPIALA